MSTDNSGLPIYQGSELHLHISGSISAALVPWWIHWLRATNPAVIVNVSVSNSATRFVTFGALKHLSNGETWVDDWEQDNLPSSWRQGRSGDSQCILLFPASLDTLMRLSQGRADSPALMMMQLTNLPIIVADVLPGENPVIKKWINSLKARSNVFFVPKVEGFRSDNRSHQESGFNFPGAMEIANREIQGAA